MNAKNLETYATILLQISQNLLYQERIKLLIDAESRAIHDGVFCINVSLINIDTVKIQSIIDEHDDKISFNSDDYSAWGLEQAKALFSDDSANSLIDQKYKDYQLVDNDVVNLYGRSGKWLGFMKLSSLEYALATLEEAYSLSEEYIVKSFQELSEEDYIEDELQNSLLDCYASNADAAMTLECFGEISKIMHNKFKMFTSDAGIMLFLGEVYGIGRTDHD